MSDKTPDPKLDDHPSWNTERHPANRVSGDDPSTGAQAFCLTPLGDEAGSRSIGGRSRQDR